MTDHPSDAADPTEEWVAEAHAHADDPRPTERPVLADRCVCSHLWSDHTTWCDSMGCPCRFEAAQPAPLDPDCDGHCYPGECVCPEGGWEAEAERRGERYRALVKALAWIADWAHDHIDLEGEPVPHGFEFIEMKARKALEDSDD